MHKNKQKLFRHTISDLKECNVEKHHIYIEDVFPIFTPLYIKSMKERQSISKEINDMLKINIMRKSRSPWSSPSILVPGKDGTWEKVIPFRNLNDVKKTEQVLLHKVQYIHDKLAGAKLFKSLDLAHGHWKIDLEEKSKSIKAKIHYEISKKGCLKIVGTKITLAWLRTETIGSFVRCAIYLQAVLADVESLRRPIKTLLQIPSSAGVESEHSLKLLDEQEDKAFPYYLQYDRKSEDV